MQNLPSQVNGLTFGKKLNDTFLVAKGFVLKFQKIWNFKRLRDIPERIRSQMFYREILAREYNMSYICDGLWKHWTKLGNKS